MNWVEEGFKSVSTVLTWLRDHAITQVSFGPGMTGSTVTGNKLNLVASGGTTVGITGSLYFVPDTDGIVWDGTTLTYDVWRADFVNGLLVFSEYEATRTIDTPTPECCA